MIPGEVLIGVVVVQIHSPRPSLINLLPSIAARKKAVVIVQVSKPDVELNLYFRRLRVCAALRAAIERPCRPLVSAARRAAFAREARDRFRAAERACFCNALRDAALCPSRLRARSRALERLADAWDIFPRPV
jgi:hypothetical protein